VQTAKRYNDYVTYSELARRVLDESGILYRPHQRNWIGKIVSLVAERSAAEGGPPLTALCVSSGDEKVGAGYAYALKLMGQPKPKDLQPHAAESRLECYRFYGADLPPGWRRAHPDARGGGETYTDRAAGGETGHPLPGALQPTSAERAVRPV
jgi:hypothetical protein